MPSTPRLVVFAGPNGAGKSSHAGPILESLRISTFVNADLIARGLVGYDTSLAAFSAGRIMLKRLDELASERKDFAFESTLSSKTFAKFISLCKGAGYLVSIYYFSLRSGDDAVRRVRHRVAMGGHSIPEVDIRRRFTRSAVNFFDLYVPLADEFTVFDNTSDDEALIIATSDGHGLTVLEFERWTHLKLLAARS